MTRFSKLLLALALGFASAANASILSTFGDQLVSGGVQPVIVAGAPPDSPANRVDPNLPTSAFTGVVSINIRYTPPGGGPLQSFICTGTAISPFTILTAAHCVDPLDNGNVIDITQAGNDVRVVVNSDGTFNPATDLITANSVIMHPDYDGFGICPFAATFQCLNDDIAIIGLSQALPSNVEIYGFATNEITSGTTMVMAGYGVSGNGIQGYTVGPDFFIKRDGANVYDVCDTNDEALFSANSPCEVWYYDFDGTKNGVNRDTWCQFAGVCGGSLGNDIETHVGGGDSGGPAFVVGTDGKLLLAANNTFGGNVFWGSDTTQGDFGDIGGGILLHSYLTWIRETSGIPEPSSLALAGLALMVLGARVRRQKRRA